MTARWLRFRPRRAVGGLLTGRCSRPKVMHKRFGRLEVLRGITLEVNRGEVICLLGPSGSGKSTFLRCINHLEKIDAGRLWVDGELVGYRQVGGKLYELRETRGRAQACRDRDGLPALQPLPAHDCAPRTSSRRRCGSSKGHARQRASTRAELLDRVGLGRQARRATRSQLSGGQQQRVAIARALAMQPEADAVRRAHLRARPRARRRGARRDARRSPRDGMTMVVVTHEMGFAREVADTVVFMDAGVVVEAGDPAEVLQAPRNERTQGVPVQGSVAPVSEGLCSPTPRRILSPFQTRADGYSFAILLGARHRRQLFGTSLVSGRPATSPPHTSSPRGG